MITGESRPVPKEPGDRGDRRAPSSPVAALRVRVTAVGEPTALSGIMRLVAAAQASSRGPRRSRDRAAALLFYVALVAGAVTLVGWWVRGDPEGAADPRPRPSSSSPARTRSGLRSRSSSRSRRRSVRGTGCWLRTASRSSGPASSTLVIFDKTGTLTTRRAGGRRASRPRTASTRTTSLALAAAVEADSEHPLARAIVAAARERGTRCRRRPASRRSPAGVRGPRSTAAVVAVGGPGCSARARPRQPDPRAEACGPPRAGRCSTSSWTGAIGGRARGSRTSPPRVAPRRSHELHALGIRVAMITGDAQAVADAVAAGSGSTRSPPQVLPADKAAAVRRFQAGRPHAWRWSATASTMRRRSPRRTSESRSAPARTSRSNRPASCWSATTRATSSARSSSRARRYRKMIQNLVWATGYNVVAIPRRRGPAGPVGDRPADGRRARSR